MIRIAFNSCLTLLALNLVFQNHKIAILAKPLIIPQNQHQNINLKSKKTDAIETVGIFSKVYNANKHIGNKSSRLVANGHSSHKRINMLTLVVNIIADLCPHGMLPLAFGLAQGGPTGIIPAISLVVLFGSTGGYTMFLLSKLADLTHSNTIGEVWAKLIGEKSQWVVDASIFSLCIGCCIFYSAFMGDIFTALSSVVFQDGLLSKRWFILSLLTATLILPLCLLQDISALQFSSVIGVVGILYTCIFHVYRLVKGTYTIGSPMLAFLSSKQLPHWPSPKFSIWRLNSGSLVLMNMLCVAFLVHYNAISYRQELEDNTPNRYGLAVGLGFGTAILIFSIMMMVGYAIFGSASQPLILNNFARSQDGLASVSRLAIGFAIACAYPLMFAGAKSSMCNLLHLPLDTSSPKKNLLISAVVAAVLAVAIQCGEEEVSLVLGIVGSVLGCFVAYILPGMLDLAYMRKRAKAGQPNPRWEVLSSHVLVAVGLVLAALGAWITVQMEMQVGAAHGGATH